MNGIKSLASVYLLRPDDTSITEIIENTVVLYTRLYTLHYYVLHIQGMKIKS